MGVYIKGMEMPKDIEPDLVIEFANSIDGKRYARLYHYRYGGLTEWLEAISIPPHGRLIDADALEYEEAYLNGHYELGDVEIVTRKDIESAPTVIPASEKEE